jgi:hypothetical protein
MEANSYSSPQGQTLSLSLSLTHSLSLALSLSRNTCNPYYEHSGAK